MYWREEREKLRMTAFFAVLMLHAVLGTILMRSSSTLLSARMTPDSFFISFLPPVEQREPAGHVPPSKANANESAVPKPRGTGEMPRGASAPQTPPDSQTEITPIPPVDWAHEADMAVRSSMDHAMREKLYRNLAGLSGAQLDWIQKNHMEPVDTNPPWAETAPRNNADGVVWISDNCALVDLLPVCRIKIGRRKPRGDLFKNMRPYLDQRETDPLP